MAVQQGGPEKVDGQEVNTQPLVLSEGGFSRLPRSGAVGGSAWKRDLTSSQLSCRSP